MGQTGSVLLDFLSIYTKAFDLVVTESLPLPYRKRIDYADGTGADKADLLFWDQRTLGASATEDLDLRGGLTDAWGATLQFVRVNGIIVFAALANTNTVNIGGAAATQFVGWVANSSDIVIVRPGGLFALFARDATAYPAGAGASDFLRIGNGGAGTSVTYDIAILGGSA